MNNNTTPKRYNLAYIAVPDDESRPPYEMYQDRLDDEEPMEPLDVSLRGLLEKAAAIVKDAHKDGGRPVRACMFPPQQAMSKAERKAKKAARKAKPIRDWIVPAQRLVLIPRQGDAAGWLIDFVEYEPLSRDAHEFAVKKGHSHAEAEAFARFVDKIEGARDE